MRNAEGILVPLGDIAHLERTQVPAIIQRENGARVATVSANPRDGAPIGPLSSAISAKVRDPEFLPAGVHIVPRGDIEQFLETVSKMLAALVVSVAVVYAILAVLYRSYVLPLVVMVTVPLASIGAFGTLFTLNVLHRMFPSTMFFTAQTLNLYSMLGIIMLVGLVAKNGILLVEYAERVVRDGAGAAEAMVQGARRRFRPILMTTLAMIAGMLPLALGHTIGAEYRKALGSAVAGGLASSLLLTLFVVPVVYVAYYERRQSRNRSRGPAAAISATPDAISPSAV